MYTLAAQSPPPVPSQVSATQGTYPGGVRLSWTAVAGANAYDIWRNDTADQSTARYLASVPGSRLEYIDSSIPAGKSYFYWVRTVIYAGIPSDFGYSHEGFWLPGPPAPDNVQASDGLYESRIYITWNASASASGYEVWRNVINDRNTAVRIATSAATEHWDEQVDMQTTYYYWVKAFNPEGTSLFSGGNPGSAKPAPPEAVSSLSASSGAYLDKVRLDWSPARGATHYEIWRSDNAQQWRSERIATVYDSTLYDDTETGALQNYSYWVRAVNSVGYGAFSPPASGFRELKVPDRPSSIAASEARYAGEVRVVWTGGDRAMHFEVLRNVVRDLPSAEIIARVAPADGVNEYWDAGGDEGRFYFYWVRGVNNAGAGEASWSTLGYWQAGPSAPTYVQASDGALQDTVSVSWLPAANATSYQIWRSSVQDKTQSTQIGVSTTTEFIDDTARIGEMYFYWVKASNAQGTSGFSWPDSGYAEGPIPIARSLEISSRQASEGARVTLSVELVTPGGDNALAWSMQFDPSLLEFKSLAAGADLPAGSVLIDSLESAANGQIGVAIALAPGDGFATGAFELLQVEFVVKPGSAGRLAPVSFGDEPRPRELVSATAEPLAARWVHGSVEVVAQSAPEYEGDVAPVPEGDGKVNLQDWVQIGRWAAALDPLPSGGLFDRADCAPRSTLGDGKIDLADWVQAGRYAQGLDPLTESGSATLQQNIFFSAMSTTDFSAMQTMSEGAQVRVEMLDRAIADQQNVPVVIESDGGVNAVSFTIEFEAAGLEYIAATLGPEIEEAGGMLIANDQHSDEGRLGFLVAMPGNRALPDGSSKLVDLQLSLADPDSAGPFPLSFSSALVDLAVSDTAARPLDAEFVSGTLTVTDSTEGSNPGETRLQASIDTGSQELSFSWSSQQGESYRVERSLDLGKWQTVDRVSGQPERTELRKWIGDDSRVFIRVIPE
jgi:hypothetical protein